MRILVTGGAGFIGSQVAERYLKLGHEVAVVDDLSTGSFHFVPEGARFYQMDILDPRLREVFREFRPEIVNHHAAQISVVKSTQNPEEDARVNVLGALRVIQWSLEFGVRRFIYVSTGGALYGEPVRLPCREGDPAHPLSPYGVAKLAVEHYLYSFYMTHGFRYVVLRYGNVYGPRQDPNGEAGVVAIFTQRMLRRQPVIIYGNGNQERDFVFVDDIVEANVLALEAPVQNGHPTAPIFNLGTGQGTTVKEIFYHLKRFTGYPLEARYDPPRPGEVFRVYLDASKAWREWGWKPQHSLQEGLRKTVEWFRQQEQTTSTPHRSQE